MGRQIRVLVVGCGHMGSSHARSYRKMEEFEIVGLVSRGPESRGELSRLLGGLPGFDSFDRALEETEPDAVSINTFADTHADYAIKSLESGAHVFVEKPIARDVSRAKPVRVHAIGARLTDEIDHDMYNYGQLQVVFDDGSVGWYESGWGPMISETAFFVKDIVGPKGCVSIISPESGSSDLQTHTRTNRIRIHHSELARDGSFDREDEIIDMSDEPDHQELCDREQRFFLKSIEEDLDLTAHLDDAVNSLRIVEAADRSFRTGQVVDL